MRKFKQQFLAGPYLIWIIGFILLPLIMILYYAFTNGDGSFTLSYITAIADETNRKAMDFPETWNYMHHRVPGSFLSAGNDFK